MKKFKWKKEKYSEDSDMHIARIPKIGFIFYVFYNKTDGHTEATILHHFDLDHDLLIKAGQFGPEKGKQICEKYFDKFIKTIKKNF